MTQKKEVCSIARRGSRRQMCAAVRRQEWMELASGLERGWRDRNELWTDRMTSSHMYFRGLKPDMHAIVILNHRLGKPGSGSWGVAVPGRRG